MTDQDTPDPDELRELAGPLRDSLDKITVAEDTSAYRAMQLSADQLEAAAERIERRTDALAKARGELYDVLSRGDVPRDLEESIGRVLNETSFEGLEATDEQ